MQNENITIIKAGESNKKYWHDLWKFRELFLFLTWRDILVRYKQTAIGITWSILRPFLTMVVFTFVFGKVAQLPTEGAAPYALMVFTALLPWQMFSNAVQESSNSLISNADMISKVYFPRMIIPASAIITAVVDFLIASVVFAGMMIYFQFMPDWKIIFIPAFMLLALATAIGIGLFISALNVSYRDFRYVIPFIVQLGLYISPVGFSSSIVPEDYRLLYSLNPMVGVIDGFRWCLLGEDVQFYLPGFVLSITITLTFLILGFRTFRKMERTFADKI